MKLPPMTRYAVTYRTPAGRICELNRDSDLLRELMIVALTGSGAEILKRYEFEERLADSYAPLQEEAR